MKAKLYILFILLGLSFIACNRTANNTTQIAQLGSIKTVSEDSIYKDKNKFRSCDHPTITDKKEPKVVIKNKADYSDNFISELKKIPYAVYQKFELIDSLLIINEVDTVYFPKTPKMKQRIVLTGKKENLAIALTVERINYTAIDYTVEMVEYGKTKYSQKGQAEFGPTFFLGEESDTSEKTGLAYFSTEYTEYKGEDCYTYIRLGYEKETGPYLLGKLIKNCNGKIKDIALDNFTNLIEK